MKQALAAIEVRALVREFSGLKGARLSQIYELAEGDFLLAVHLAGIGKENVRVKPPFLAYRGASKPVIEGGESSGFLGLLRGKVSGGRILDQYQHGFDRVWVLDIGGQEVEFRLIFEFFGKGNIILVDKDYVVLGALLEQSFGVRSTKKRETYAFPKGPKDLYSMNEKGVLEVILASRFDQLVKALAADLSLGGLYAEEVCSQALIDKAMHPSKATLDDVKRIIASAESLVQAHPSVVYEDAIPVDVLIAPIVAYKGKDTRIFDSFSQAQEAFWSSQVVVRPKSSRRQKLEVMIEQQEKSRAAIELRALASQRAGEAIYLRYAQVRGILDAVKKFGKKDGFAALKAHLKDDPMVRSIDEKKGIITIELPDQ